MRRADTVLGVIQLTGKRCDTKASRTVWREADGKGLRSQYLTGGPPYLVLGDTCQGPAAERLTPLFAGIDALDRCASEPFPRETMDNESIKGDDQATYGALGRARVTERGMTYGWRHLRSRTPRSSRGRDDPPRRTKTPSTGRRGTP